MGACQTTSHRPQISSRTADGQMSVSVEIRADGVAEGAAITAAIGDIDGVDLIESKAIGD